MNATDVQTLLDCNIEEAEKFKTILEFCKKFDKNALNSAVDLTHLHNFSICLDNVLNSMLNQLIDNLVDTIYKDIQILLSIEDFSIAIDTDNILNNNDNIVVSYEGENKDIFNWLKNNCDDFVEF